MTEQVKPLLVSLGQHKAEVLDRLARSIRTGQDWDDLREPWPTRTRLTRKAILPGTQSKIWRGGLQP